MGAAPRRGYIIITIEQRGATAFIYYLVFEISAITFSFQTQWLCISFNLTSPFGPSELDFPPIPQTKA